MFEKIIDKRLIVSETLVPSQRNLDLLFYLILNVFLCLLGPTAISRKFNSPWFLKMLTPGKAWWLRE